MMKSYVNEALTASSFWGVDPKELGDVIAKYGPFDFLSVKNDSGYTISFMVDDDSNRQQYLVSGERLEMDNIPFNTVSVVNEGVGTIAAKEIKIVIGREERVTRRRRFW